MRILLASLLSFTSCFVLSQSTNLIEELIGCWEYVDLVDTVTLEHVKIFDDQDRIVHDWEIKVFEENEVYREGSKEMTWRLNNDQTIVLYETSSNENDQERANLMGEDVEEIVKKKFSGIRLTNDLLYYQIFLEYGEVIYAKLRKTDCP